MTCVLGPGAATNECRGETVSVSKYAGRAVEDYIVISAGCGDDETSRDSWRMGGTDSSRW